MVYLGKGEEKVLNNFRLVVSFLLFTFIFSVQFIFADEDDFVRIEGGSFVMGSPIYERGRNSGEIQHRVRVSPFFMAKYLITQEKYEEVMENNPSLLKGENLPVENITWFEAIEYCNRRSQLEGLNPVYTVDIGRIDLGNLNNNTRWLVTWNRSANGYRLPTEAEWEYAAKGGNLSPGDFTFSGSNNQVEVAWYVRNSGGSTHPVGTKKSNGLDLYDMSGNVWEWCWDWYGNYISGAGTNPTGAARGSHRVVRGGSCFDSAAFIRSAYRYSCVPSNRSIGVGFRIVRSDLPEDWTESLFVP
jgi:formylglycine-generating enzyme required for sulfatase activity